MVVTRDGLGTIAKLTGGLSATEFDEMAIGNGATAGTSPSETDTALTTETQRDTDVTGTTETTNFTADTQRYVGTFSFSASDTITEFGVFNGAATDIMLLRQIFNEGLNVENGDSLDVTVDVVTTMPNNDADGTRPETVIVQDGVANTNELCVSDVTDPSNGAFSAMALGNDDGTNLAAADSNSKLGKEFIGSGLSRTSATVTQETTNVSGTNGGGDTTRFNASFTATATVDINECGVFDTATSPSDDATGDADKTTNSSGEMLFRHIFDSQLDFVSDDTLDMTVDVVNEN